MVEIMFEKENLRAVAMDLENKVGICEYTENGDIWNIVHTIVDEKYRGQNIARRLVECVIKEAKINNKKIIASCSYANKLIQIKHKS